MYLLTDSGRKMINSLPIDAINFVVVLSRSLSTLLCGLWFFWIKYYLFMFFRPTEFSLIMVDNNEYFVFWVEIETFFILWLRGSSLILK
jgi:hypothetical protein